MKITKRQLKYIIQEELEIVLSEAGSDFGKFDGMTGKPVAGSIPRGTTPFGMSQKELQAMTRSQYDDILAMARSDWKAGKKAAFAKPPSALSRASSAVTKALPSSVTKALPAVGKVVSRFAGPVGLALGAHDIYQGLQDPDFWTGLSRFGGEEAAYDTWAEQAAEAGDEVPTYEEWKVKEARLKASGQI